MKHKPLWLVVNGASGSNDDQAVRALIVALDAAGRTPARVVDVSRDEAVARAGLDTAGVGTVAIFTGDGTINSVVGALDGWDGQVLVLPGGTMNLFSKSLHGDVPAEQIAAALGQGRLAKVRRSVVASAHGKALCEVLAGPGATWSDVREELRDGNIGGVAATAVEAARQSTVGAMVVVSDPALGKPEGYSGVRLVPTGEAMTVDGYGADTIGDYFSQAVALLKRDFREGPHDELGSLHQVTCRSTDDSPVELMIDGERVTGAAQVRFELAPLAVDLLALNG